MSLKDRRFPGGPYVRTVDGNPPDANGDVASSGTGGGGSATGQAFVAVDPSKHLPDSTVGTWARSTTASAEVYLVSSGTQNDEAVWSLPLGPGTYDLKFAFSRDTNRGIVTVAVDDGAGVFTNLTTVDTYGAGDLQVVTVTGLVVTGSALRRQVRLKMATKNASSSAYYLTVHGFSWSLTSAPAGGGGGGGGAPSGPAGGVLSGTYPDPGFAADMATQAELDAHAAAADPHTGYQKESEKSAASGYASLDGSTKVPIGELPTGTTSSTVSLGNHTHSAVASPDDVPASPNALDYEFEADTTSLPTGWSWVNQGTSTYKEKYGRGRIVYATSTAVQFRGIEEAFAGAATWDFACKIGLNTTHLNYYEVNMFLHDSVSGKVLSFSMDLRGAFAKRWNSPTSWSSETSTTGPPGWPYRQSIYMRMVKTSSTNIDLYTSVTGDDWMKVHSMDPSGWVPTPTHIGWGGSFSTTARAADSHVWCDWFRRLA